MAGAALAAAETRMGDPYELGDVGPNMFDCSGLMLWSYAQAGVHLPRTAIEQAGAGVAVDSLADARPGDLIIFNGGEHVAMYLGNGMVIHAPRPGESVRHEQVRYLGSIYAIRRI